MSGGNTSVHTIAIRTTEQGSDWDMLNTPNGRFNWGIHANYITTSRYKKYEFRTGSLMNMG